jgi:hypothetical protein
MYDKSNEVRRCSFSWWPTAGFHSCNPVVASWNSWPRCWLTTECELANIYWNQKFQTAVQSCRCNSFPDFLYTPMLGQTKQQTRTNRHIFLQTITLSPNSLASPGFTAIQPQLFFHVIAVCYPLPTHTVSPVPLLISKNKNLKGTRLQCVKSIVSFILLSGPLKDKM